MAGPHRVPPPQTAALTSLYHHSEQPPLSFYSNLVSVSSRPSHERAEPQHFRYASCSLPLNARLSIPVLPRSLGACANWPTDPFADEGDLGTSQDVGSQQNYIHIRIQQRNGRKTLTTLQGLPKGASPFYYAGIRRRLIYTLTFRVRCEEASEGFQEGICARLRHQACHGG